MGKKARNTEASDTWERWWELNREPYLRADLPGRAQTLTGLPRANEKSVTTPVTLDEIRDVVAPALRTALGAEDPTMLDSAAIAIGRALPFGEAAEAVVALQEHLASPYPTVRQSSLLGLGMLGHRASVPLLWNVMNDTAQGRRSVGRASEIQSMDRAFAAIALGYIGDPAHVSFLLRLVEGEDDVELAGAAVMALGRFPKLPQDAIVSLLQAFADDRIDSRVRAHIPICLGRVGGDTVVALPRLLLASRDSDVPLDVRRSAVIALGQLAGEADAEVHLALRTICNKEKDSLLRHLAFVSVGRVGARMAGSSSAGAVRSIAGFLAREIADPSQQADRPWAAIAAGVLGNALSMGDPALSALTSEVSTWQRRTSSPSDQSAAAIALGLMRDDASGAEVLTTFKKTRDPSVRAYLATSLGLMRYHEAREDLVKALLEERDPDQRIAAATALAQLGDTNSSAELLAAFVASPTYAEAAAMARALGRIGDHRLLPDLAAVIEDRTGSDILRGFACVALGMIAEKTALPWNAPLSIDANFALPHAAQTELLDIF